MNQHELEKLKYPIGKFIPPSKIDEKQTELWITSLEELPKQFKQLVTPFSEEQLQTPYRPDGWTVRQVIHHLADSHHNSYIRFKWALTEDNPVIKPYDEKAWSDLFDSKSAPIQMSLDHLQAVHTKLVYLLRGLSEEQLQRKFIHPDGNEATTLKENIGRYAWHGSHHLAHVQNLADRSGW